MRTKTNKMPENKLSDLTPRKDAGGGRLRPRAGARGCHRSLMRVPNAAFPAHLPD